ncbi:MAG: ribbon-helix-helix protein, CopG family [Ideonella sp.]|nr:ribbon-helix-helix protein, CopG family [Ideonella sp.]
MSRARLNIFIEPDHARRLEQLAAHQGVSKSAVIAAALSSFLSPETAERREAIVAHRLDSLSRQFGRLERDQNILVETVALYVRYFLTVSIPVPEGQLEAARAQGRARYGQFLEQLGRHLQHGRSLVRDLQTGGVIGAAPGAAGTEPSDPDVGSPA